MGAVSKIRSLEISRIAEEVVARATALPIEPRRIATDCQITIRSWEPEKQGISGFLMKQGDAFGIGYSTRIKNDIVLRAPPARISSTAKYLPALPPPA